MALFPYLGAQNCDFPAQQAEWRETATKVSHALPGFLPAPLPAPCRLPYRLPTGSLPAPYRLAQLLQFFSCSKNSGLTALRNGRPVIVTDDEDRENEGDLIMAAQHVTAEWCAFFVRHTSGILCVSMEGDRAEKLRLPQMVKSNEDAHGTAFTVSVDHVDSTTGISAVERSTTIIALANESCTSSTFRRPGHVFPLVARRGGVLERRGHTEASVDLCRMSGLRACGLLSEIVSHDSMHMRRRG